MVFVCSISILDYVVLHEEAVAYGTISQRAHNVETTPWRKSGGDITNFQKCYSILNININFKHYNKMNYWDMINNSVIDG